MCDPVSIGTAVVGLAAAQAMQPSTPKTPKVPTPEAPPQAQAAKAPDEAARRAAMPAVRNAATMLTGAGGIDASALNLGRNTLLGG